MCPQKRYRHAIKESKDAVHVCNTDYKINRDCIFFRPKHTVHVEDSYDGHWAGTKKKKSKILIEFENAPSVGLH